MAADPIKEIDYLFVDEAPVGPLKYRLERRGKWLNLFCGDEPVKKTNKKNSNPDLLAKQRQSNRLCQPKVLAVLEHLLINFQKPLLKTDIEVSLNCGDLDGYLTKLRKLLNDSEAPRRLIVASTNHVTFSRTVTSVLLSAGAPTSRPNTVESLPLTTLKHLRRQAPVDPNDTLRLLDPRFCNLPFVGRLDDSNRLWDWLHGKAKVSFQVVAGHGGRGKTRLAIYLLELLELRKPEEWHAGFLDAECCKDALTYKTFRHWRGSRPTLIVIDDASRWAEVLAANIVRPVCEPVKDAFPLRFLLIDRGVDERFNWYQHLVDTAETHGPYMFMPPLRLRALSTASELDLGERYQLLDTALQTLHEFDNQHKLLIDETTRESLRSPEMGDPLILFMAAIVAHERRDLSPVTYRRLDLADELARRERRRITSLAASYTLPLHMAAYVTLARGLTLENLHAACKEEQEALGSDSTWNLVALRTLISEKLLPSDNPALAAAPIVPDVVGEVFVERIFQAPDQSPVKTMFRAFLRQSDSVTRTILNMVHDFGLTAEESQNAAARQQQILDWIEKLLQMLVRDAETSDNERQHGAALARMARAVALAKELAQAKPRIFAPRLAWSYGAWATALGAAGRQQEALEKFAAGLRQIKPLALSHPERYWDLAVRLANGYCSACQSTRNSADLKLSAPFAVYFPPNDDQASTLILDEMIRQTPIEKLPSLAFSLEQLAPQWGDSLRTAAREALRRHEAFNHRDRGAVPEEQVLFLEDQAQQWNDAGYAQEALESLDEAIPLFRLLANENKALLPHLASSLSLQADLESKRLNRQGTVRAITEAASLYRDLASHDTAYRQESALSAWKVAILLAGSQKPESRTLLLEALPYYFEVGQVGEQYSLAPALWGSLYNMLAILNWEMGQEDAALEILGEKCRAWARPNNIRVRLAGKDDIDLPAAIAIAFFLPPSAHSYLTLEFGHRDPLGLSWQHALKYRIEAEYALRCCGDLKSALAFVRHATELCQELADRDRQRFLPPLVHWLNRLQQWLTDDGLIEEALRVIDHAIPYSIELINADRGDFQPVLDGLQFNRRRLLNLKPA